MAKNYPENLLNQYVYIYWKDDDVWYRAKVIRYLEQSKKYKVVYDDKNEEKIDLSNEWFLIEDDNLKSLANQRKKIFKAELQTQP